MILFPGVVEVPFHGTTLKFSIVPIDKNIYEMSNDMSLMKNDDKMTFGYLIHKNGYLYAYGISPIENPTEAAADGKEQKYRFDVVFSTYVGPEDVNISDEKYVNSLVYNIAIAFGNRAMYLVQHPSVVQQNRFGKLMDELLLDMEKIAGPEEVQSPYIYTMLHTARMLADFYVKMVESLEEITEDDEA